jgi:chromosome segregation ATPase
MNAYQQLVAKLKDCSVGEWWANMQTAAKTIAELEESNNGLQSALDSMCIDYDKLNLRFNQLAESLKASEETAKGLEGENEQLANQLQLERKTKARASIELAVILYMISCITFASIVYFIIPR